MKNVYDVAKVVLLFLILSVLILGAFNGGGGGKLEYKFDKLMATQPDWIEHLNVLAKDGWELHSHEEFKYSTDKLPTRYSILKRRK